MRMRAGQGGVGSKYLRDGKVVSGRRGRSGTERTPFCAVDLIDRKIRYYSMIPLS